jgi:hypothetical protein
VSAAEQSTQDIFKEWVEAYDAKESIIDPYFAPPIYAQKTVRRRIEPYATRYDCWNRVHPSYYSENGEPESEWYAPTPKLLKLEALLDKLEAKGFETVPNPDYDEQRAEEYYETRRARYRPGDQTTITVGQSYNPDLTAVGSRIAAVYTTAFPDTPDEQNETPDQG